VPPFLLTWGSRYTSVMDDESLMIKYREGDAKAFERLYERHKGPLFRYIYRQTNDSSVAEDLFQEIWINLIRSRERYRQTAKFSTYLFRIAHNRLIDYYRSQKNAIPASYQDDPELIHTDSRDQPEHQAVIDGQIENLLELVQKLPEAQREAFILKEESGLTLEEIAEVTQSNRETVKSRLRYAFQKLRSGMKE